MGCAGLPFADQSKDSAQAFVADNVGLAHGDGLVSDLALQNPFPGTYFDVTIDEFEHGYTLFSTPPRQYVINKRLFAKLIYDPDACAPVSARRRTNAA